MSIPVLEMILFAGVLATKNTGVKLALIGAQVVGIFVQLGWVK